MTEADAVEPAPDEPADGLGRPAARARSAPGWSAWPPTRWAGCPPSSCRPRSSGSRPSRPRGGPGWRAARSPSVLEADDDVPRAAGRPGARAGARPGRRAGRGRRRPRPPTRSTLAAVAYLLRPAGLGRTWSRPRRDAADAGARAAEPRRGRRAGRAAAPPARRRSTEELEETRAPAHASRSPAQGREHRAAAQARRRAAPGRARPRRPPRRPRPRPRRARAAAAAAPAAAEAEVRRLRARVEELERDLGRRPPDRARRAGRPATLRARLLLDTLLEAAQGLRRELALPRGRGLAGRPGRGARRRAGEPDARPGTARWPSTTRRCSSSCSRLPRAHLSSTATTSPRPPGPSCRWSGSATGCSAGWRRWSARSGAEVTVVFDAADDAGAAAGRTGRAGVRVLFSPLGVIADDVIRELVGGRAAGPAGGRGRPATRRSSATWSRAGRPGRSPRRR